MTKINKHGHLINYKDWNIAIAMEIAKSENILLNKEHWKIIYITKKFYSKFKISPTLRMLITVITKKYKKKITSEYLYNLFPPNPAILITKISGLPKSKKCL